MDYAYDLRENFLINTISLLIVLREFWEVSFLKGLF